MSKMKRLQLNLLCHLYQRLDNVIQQRCHRLLFFRYCNGEKSPEALTKVQTAGPSLAAVNSNNKNVNVPYEEGNHFNQLLDDNVDERLPRSINPVHYRLVINQFLSNISPKLCPNTFFNHNLQIVFNSI